MRSNAVADWTRDKKLLDAARARRGLVLGVDGGDPVVLTMPATSVAEGENSIQSLNESKEWLKTSPCPDLPVLPMGAEMQMHREKDCSAWDFADFILSDCEADTYARSFKHSCCKGGRGQGIAKSMGHQNLGP